MAELKYDANMAPSPDRWLALDESHAEWLVHRYHASARCTHPRTQTPVLHATFHVVVEKQIAMGDTTPARATLDRLMREGLSRHDAVHAIGSVLATQVHGLLSASQPEPAPATEQLWDEMRRLTAESWRRSATEDSIEPPAWLAVCGERSRPCATRVSATSVSC